MKKLLMAIVFLLIAILLFLVNTGVIKADWKRLVLLDDSVDSGFTSRVMIVHDRLENVNCYIVQSGLSVDAGMGIFCMKAEK